MDSSYRQAFWMQNVGLVQSLLADVNADLMDNQGMVSADVQSSQDSAFPHLTPPSLSLTFHHPKGTPGSISVCVAPDGAALRLRAAVRESAVLWRDVSENELEAAMRSALAWLIDQGVLESWLR
ncbi:MAG: hypothetical protein IT308_08940 [Anaerolineaceae bacterium]|nr:hypothetical protein [Anaerolineaceae bacterium]